MNPLRWTALLPIRFYQRFISPLKPPSCRFHPTCSAYAYKAILTHGIVKGWLLATWRIVRCQPFSEGGWDPVPAPGAWRAVPTAGGIPTADADAGEDAREPPEGQERA